MKWGILGTGNIAKKIADALARVPSAELTAVGSRTREGADVFGAMFNVPRRYASYEALAADEELDVIYVATPNAFHFAHASLCLSAGRAVLLEKPFAVNATEAEALVALARSRGLFLMEAMWTRFVPAVERAFAWIKEGAIGEVRAVEASFGFRAEPHELPALVSRELATGSLLDVGVYCVSLAHAAFARPLRTAACVADLAEGGADLRAAFVLGFEGGGVFSGSSSVAEETRHDALISGTGGNIRLHAPFWCAKAATLSRASGEELFFDGAYPGNGYEYELDAVMSCLREGRTEHVSMSLAGSVEVMQTLDRLRR